MVDDQSSLQLKNFNPIIFNGEQDPQRGTEHGWVQVGEQTFSYSNQKLQTFAH